MTKLSIGENALTFFLVEVTAFVNRNQICSMPLKQRTELLWIDLPIPRRFRKNLTVFHAYKMITTDCIFTISSQIQQRFLPVLHFFTISLAKYFR